ncbi:MAG: ATP-binding cassette domain-containing protein [Acidimicrobiia bacterium]|nr:ATP-binding cassette domain-containing protein [Acidimicrobiia bacterium]
MDQRPCAVPADAATLVTHLKGDALLSLVDLHKRFGDVVALDGAGFEVQPGRIVGFLGPNGAGKTTAMRCILGLVDADRGQVLWNSRATEG